MLSWGAPDGLLPNLALLLHLGHLRQHIPALLHLLLQVFQVGKTICAGSLEVFLGAGAAQLDRQEIRGHGGHQVRGLVAVEGDARDHPLAQERLQEGEELVEHPRVVDKVDCSEPKRETSREKVAEAAKLLDPEHSEVLEPKVGEVDNNDDSADLSPWFNGDQLEEPELVRVKAFD